MSVNSLLQKIKLTVGEWVNALQGKPKPEHPLIRYGTPILFTLFALAALSAIYVGYRWYATGRAQNAQYACSMLMDEYMTLQKEENPDYAIFLAKTEVAYKKYRNTAVAPYIGLLVVDIYTQLKNQEQAVAAMNELMTIVQSNTVVGDLFKVKQALLMLDTDNEQQREEGLNNLTLLADNPENQHRDYAQYHLGLYYWNENNLSQARLAWQDLVESQEVELRAPSPWADVVAEKLATIPA